MKLFNRKIRIFYVSNILLSFSIAGVLGISYCITNEDTVSSKSEVAHLDTEVIPLSQKGEETQKEVEVTKESKTISTKKKMVTTVVATKKEVKASKNYVPAVYSEVTGQAIVDYAMKYLGLRYVGNGYSLSTGTDCSGFTKLIYQEFGIKLSRAVRAQASNGTYVSKADLQKGDLVFYGYGNGVVRHVGIYIGNGQVLHESNPRDGVKISTVNMMQYITARRVINSTAIKMVEEKIEKEAVEAKEEVVLETNTKTIDESNLNKEVTNETLDNKEIQDGVNETVINSNDNNVSKEIVSEELTNNNETNIIEEASDNTLINNDENIQEEVKLQVLEENNNQQVVSNDTVEKKETINNDVSNNTPEVIVNNNESEENQE